MKAFLTTILLAAALAAQSLPVAGTVTIPAGTFQAPLTVDAPLNLSGATLSCPTCGSGGGGGGTTSNLFPWQPATWLQPPALASWTQINAGGNGLFSDVRGGVLINSVSGNNIKMLEQAAPSPAGTPFTVTAHFTAQCQTNSYAGFGLLIGDTGSKTVQWKLLAANNNGPGMASVLDEEQWDTPTSPHATAYLNPGAGTTADSWLRIIYNGTNLTMQASPTGTDAATFTTYRTETANAYLASAPAVIGFGASSQLSGAPCLGLLNYWNVTEP